jgi:hypothetical protein
VSGNLKLPKSINSEKVLENLQNLDDSLSCPSPKIVVIKSGPDEKDSGEGMGVQNVRKR